MSKTKAPASPADKTTWKAGDTIVFIPNGNRYVVNDVSRLKEAEPKIGVHSRSYNPNTSTYWLDPSRCRKQTKEEDAKLEPLSVPVNRAPSKTLTPVPHPPMKLNDKGALAPLPPVPAPTPAPSPAFTRRPRSKF